MRLAAELVVSYPRITEIDKRYELTIDLQHDAAHWTLPGEEYAIHCVVDGAPAFSCEADGDAAIVVHRFGGSYGPARFVLTARGAADAARVRVTLLDARGAMLRSTMLDPIRVLPRSPVPQPARPALPHGALDHAIVIGVDRHASDRLYSSAVDDARAFHAWLISPDGGRLPTKQAKLLVPDPKGDLRRSAIERAFAELEGAIPPVGRRLYVFAAGDGGDAGHRPVLFASGPPSFEDSALDVVGHTVRASAGFGEVVLFMDVDRTAMKGIAVGIPTYPGGNWLFGFSTSAGRPTFPARTRPGQPREMGPFTQAILETLYGDHTRALMASTLASQVSRRIAELQAVHPISPKPDHSLVPQFDISERDLELLPAQTRSHRADPRDDDSVADPLSNVIIGSSRAMRDVVASIHRIAARGAACLIVGEFGSGKLTVARAIHEASDRRHGPLVVISDLVANVHGIETKLFGDNMPGAIHRASGGTLVLADVDCLPMVLQDRLADALERAGDTLRMIATSSEDHEDSNAHDFESRFRRRLYDRLTTEVIRIPPLRDHAEDIPELAQHFARRIAPHRALTFTREALEALMRESWPQNTLELYDVIERAIARTTGSTIAVDALRLQQVSLQPWLGNLGPIAWDVLWPNGSTLTVRFLNASASLQRRVQTIMREWSRAANITFAFDQRAHAAAIRIAFGDEGSWAYRGTNGLRVPSDQPTVNIALPPETSDGELRTVVLQKLGIVLGLVSETQSPNARIAWNPDAVYAALTAPPHRRSRADIDTTVFATYGDAELQVGRYSVSYRPFDPSSVMMPAFPATWTLDAFSSAGSDTLSQLDIDFIRHLYPPDIEVNLERAASVEKASGKLHFVHELAPRESHCLLYSAHIAWRFVLQCRSGELEFELRSARGGSVIWRGTTVNGRVAKSLPVADHFRWQLRLHASEPGATVAYEVSLSPARLAKPKPPAEEQGRAERWMKGLDDAEFSSPATRPATKRPVRKIERRAAAKRK